MRAQIAVVLACGLGVGITAMACGAGRRPIVEPMAGSAAIGPSPALAERVPSDVDTSAAPIPRSAPSTTATATTATSGKPNT